MTNEGMSPADYAAINGNNGWGGGWDFWIILFLIFAFCGWGGNGGYGGGGVNNGYVLASDFATIQRQLSDGFNSIDNALDRQNAGICDLGYTQLSLNNGTNMAMMQGFNQLGTQLADCCCKTQTNIADVKYNNAMNTTAITNAIKDCCCDTEKMFMQNRFDNAQYNCTTLQAIDKVGDRIIDYLAADKAQALRDENQALRLAASQSQQNSYLLSQLKPYPIPSFEVPNPFAYAGNRCGYCNG